MHISLAASLYTRPWASAALDDMRAGLVATMYLPTWLYVLEVDSDKLVTVRSALLMPPAQSMEHLVHHNALELTSLTDGDILWASYSTNEGETPV